MDETLRQRFAPLSVRDMLLTVARERDGKIRIAALAEEFCEAGLFATERSASKAISTTVARHPDEFERIQRGRYRLVRCLTPKRRQDRRTEDAEPERLA